MDARTDSQLLTEKQLKERLWINRGTLWKLRKQGLPYIQLGRLIRFNFDDVMAWLKGNSESYQKWNSLQVNREEKGSVTAYK
jgi:excisionase family DNA binding protein